MTDTIDAHHHFWHYDPVEYGWIGDAMSEIRRDFLPTDLRAEIEAAGVDGVISVQARQKIEETEWLLELAKEHDFIRGVVGWIRLASPGVRGDLERLAGEPKLKGVRHVLQDESDDDYALRDDFNAGVSLLREFGLAYDILISERHLPQAILFVDRHPDQIFVVDHVAKPRILDNAFSPWRENIAELARRENVYCKVSGMATETDFRTWTTEQLRPYFDVVLQAFGPARLMFGSDWPVVLVACGYKRWCETTRAFASELSDAEQRRIFGETATEAYRLVPSDATRHGIERTAP